MSKPIVFMFSGQGSQYYQMGKELYEKHPRFKLWMNHCDNIVSPLIGESLIDILYSQHNKNEAFDRIIYTNPALLSVEYSLAKVLMESGIKPDIFLGYSLGELTAAILSQGISLEQGLSLSINFAKLLEQDSPQAGMLAIMESESIMIQCSELFEGCYLSGKNFHNNFVVSGLLEPINRLQIELQKKGIISQKLAVKYAFHSEIINSHAEKFKKLAQSIQFFNLRTPIISSLTSQKIQELDESYLWNVVRYPVEFSRTVENLLKCDDYCFIDVGPSGTLATLIKYLLPKDSKSIYMETINQYGRDIESINKLTTNLIHQLSVA